MSRHSTLQSGSNDRACLISWQENLRSECSMEAKRNMVLQLDSGYRTTVQPVGIQHYKLSGVGLRNVELSNDVAIILLALLPGVPAQPWDKHWFTDTPMRVPHLPFFLLHIKLDAEEQDAYSEPQQQKYSVLKAIYYHQVTRTA